MDSMYDSIGGQPALDLAVQRFEKRVMADPDLACQFGGIDVRRIMAHQINLLNLFFGEPVRHTPAKLAPARF
jgi:hemoglobin